jgi:4-hydroxy-4-methyl-2-oxoglutarate aldolase
MSTTLTPEELHALRGLDACTLANAIETFHERLRNEGFVDHTVRCLFPELPPMLGYAATLRIRGSAPPTADGVYQDRMDWWDYVLTLPAPRVVVIQDMATRPGLGSLVGAVHMNILRALNCIGVVTNGAVRDIPAAAQDGFHCFVGNIAVSHAYVHVVEVGTAVNIGGLSIHSGDLLHGDLHGVQSVPLAIAGALPQVAARIIARDAALIALCRSPGVTLAELRAAIARAAP